MDLGLGLGDTVKVGRGFFDDIKKYNLIEIYKKGIPKGVKLALNHFKF